MSRCSRSSIAIALLAVSWQWASAQTPTFTAEVSGYTALLLGGGVIGAADQVPIPVTRHDGFQLAQAQGEGGRLVVIPGVAGQTGPGETSAFASGFASSSPGVLRVFGADRAVARPAVGVPQSGLGNAPNVDSTAAAITASAGFTDYLTVNVPSLPMGTEVQVPFHYLAEVVSDYPLGYPPYSRHPISAYASFIIPGIGPQNFSTESGYFPWTSTTLPNGNGVYTVRSSGFSVLAHVGDVLAISGSFSVFGNASVNVNTYEREFGGFADARNTAAIWLGDLPAGMSITSASGHDYTIDPTLAPVPEPHTYAMLLAGVLALGLLVRRKGSSDASHSV